MKNCLTYALKMYRYSEDKEHLVIRTSHWGWFPHFQVEFELANGDIEKREYVPISPRPRWVPPLFFEGVERITYYKRISIGERSDPAMPFQLIIPFKEHHHAT